MQGSPGQASNMEGHLFKIAITAADHYIYHKEGLPFYSLVDSLDGQVRNHQVAHHRFDLLDLSITHSCLKIRGMSSLAKLK